MKQTKNTQVNEAITLTSAIWITIVAGVILKSFIGRLIARRVVMSLIQKEGMAKFFRLIKDAKYMKKLGIDEDVIETVQKKAPQLSKIQQEAINSLLADLNNPSGKMTVEEVYDALKGYYTTPAEQKAFLTKLQTKYPNKLKSKFDAGKGAKVGKQRLNKIAFQKIELQEPVFGFKDFDELISTTYKGPHLGNMYGTGYGDIEALYNLVKRKISKGKLDAQSVATRYRTPKVWDGIRYRSIPIEISQQIEDYLKFKKWMEKGITLRNTTSHYKGPWDPAFIADMREQIQSQQHLGSETKWMGNMHGEQEKRLAQLLWQKMKNQKLRAGDEMIWTF